MCDCDCGSEGVSATRRESAYDMIHVKDAVRRVLAATAPLEAVDVAAHRSKGFVLVEPVVSKVWPRQYDLCVGYPWHSQLVAVLVGAAATVSSVHHGWIRGRRG